MDERGIRRHSTNFTQNKNSRHKNQQRNFEQRAITGRTNRMLVQPGHNQNHYNGTEHCQNPTQFCFQNNKVGKRNAYIKINCTQNRIERQEVPFRNDMGRGNHRISWRVVIRVTQRVRHKEDEQSEHRHKHNQTKTVFHGVVRVKRKGVLFGFRFNSAWVIRTSNVQCPDVQEHNTDNHKRQQEVKCEEAVKRWVINREPAPQQFNNRRSDNRNGREQIGNNRCPPRSSFVPMAERIP